MADTEGEEHITQVSKQFAALENFGKQNTGLDLQVVGPLLLNFDSKENSPQHIEKLEESNHMEDVHQTDKTENDPLWSMYFDGSCTKTNAGAGVWITNTESQHTECISCKLKFQCSNNIAEYESLLLGLHLLKRLGAKKINVYGDSELIIRQVNGEYNANHPRLRVYRNDVMDLLKTFEDSKLIFVPRKRNLIAHNLAFAARTCLMPYETEDC